MISSEQLARSADCKPGALVQSLELPMLNAGHVGTAVVILQLHGGKAEGFSLHL